MRNLTGLKNTEQAFLFFLQEDTPKEEMVGITRNFNQDSWQELSELAINCGLLPAFYRRLTALGLENIPSQIKDKLKNIYLYNLQRNILLEKELLKILPCFEEADIAVIPLKGPLLARYIYADLSSRLTSADLDLLVKKEDLNKAKTLLERLGFGADQRSFAEYLKFRRQLTLRKTDANGTILIDLHWDIGNRFICARIEDFWNNARKTESAGYSVLMPCPEDLILYLTLVSLSSHDFIQLRYLYDLHKAILKLKDALNWKLLTEKAFACQQQTTLFFALKLSDEFFRNEIPKEVLEKLHPGLIKEKICRLWINKTNILRFGLRGKRGYIWFYIVTSYLGSKNIFDCMRLVLSRVFIPAQEVAWDYRHPQEKRYYAYIKRLFKPLQRIIKKPSRRNLKKTKIK